MLNWCDLKGWISTVGNEAERFLNTHKKDVFIYGAGIGGYWYLKYLRFKEVNVRGFIVSNPNEVDKTAVPEGLKVFSLDEVCCGDYEYSIIIGAPKYKAAIRDILCKRCSNEDIYSFEAEIYYSFIHDIEGYRLFLLDNWSRIEKLYECLGDEKSRATLQGFIMGRISGNQDFFIENMVPDQYYPNDIIHFSGNEVMVECGSNNGETMLGFVQCVKQEYNHIFLFEPDKDCIKKLKKVIENNGLRNVELIEKGAWHRKTILAFEGDDSYGSGRISDCGMEKIETDTIDNLVNIPVTFIKMDIEGAELNALKGGMHQIRDNFPKLAICVYHNIEDFLDIPEFILSINPNYKIYLRHHNWGATETVLYAIPGSYN